MFTQSNTTYISHNGEKQRSSLSDNEETYGLFHLLCLDPESYIFLPRIETHTVPDGFTDPTTQITPFSGMTFILRALTKLPPGFIQLFVWRIYGDC